MRRSHSLVLLALPGLALGQLAGILNLSDSCNKAMGQLAIGSAANCLNTMGLINVLTTPDGQSWVPPFDNYLSTSCSQPACTVDTIATLISSLKAGCSTDLAAKGWSPDDIETILQQASGYYPAAREVMCLRDTADGQKLCITTTLGNMEAMVGQPLNIGTLVSKTPTVLSSHTLDIPKNISCTPCTQGAYTLARPNLPSSSSVAAWDNFWINQCGEGFISGTLPTTIAQTANETVASSTPSPNGANPSSEIPPFAAVLASLAFASVSAMGVLRG